MNTEYDVPVMQLCKYFSIHRSHYYYWLKRHQSKKSIEDKKMEVELIWLYDHYEMIYGYRRLHIELEKKMKIKVNIKRVHRLCKQLGLSSIIRRKRNLGYNTFKEQISENILGQNFNASAPNQKWVTDITETKVGNNKHYICVVQDLFNREITSYSVSKRANTELISDAMLKAFNKNKNVKNIIIHSDQGTQFTSYKYKELLKEHEQIPSNSRAGNCLDNAVVENFFSHLKTEMLYINEIKSEKELLESIKRYIYFYNNKRVQIKTKKTPLELRNEYYENYYENNKSNVN